VRHRKRIYLIMMGTCLTLFVLSWTVVRFFSTPLAVVMSIVALVIPPFAAIVANRGGADADHRPPPD
jgi:ABC-type transport system involved in cytochrome bd biosynthesis fused ATPase/permease subunit